ncbi:MAG TPA: acylphosphatase [Burkholderiales bacterium]|nr:acylphosphatase [Burkholderiales bacterium]
MKVTKHVIVHGRVQGVGYRASTRLEAERLGVTGWVRNRRDGTVEAALHGRAEQIEQMLDWMRRGPAIALVVRVEVSDASGAYETFEMRPSA